MTGADTIDARGLTLIGLSIGDLTDVDRTAEQLLVPFGRKDTSGLDSMVDELRQRFGSGALTRASMIGRRVSSEVPKLPD